MRFFSAVAFVCVVAGSARAEVLHGFRIEPVVRFEGFVTSVVVDSKGTIYATTTDGWIHRLDGTQMTRVAALPTHSGGNGGLLGMALIDDETAVVHYTTWREGTDLVLDDVISRVDLATGAETVLKSFACDVESRERGASSEHHGGNPIVAPDGSVFVGIGEYGVPSLAQKDGWNAGRVWRIDPSGNATEFARGLRNPFDLAWDERLGQIVIADNGPDGGDEIHVISSGANCGWPPTPPVADAVDPLYVFDQTVAPTGLVGVNGAQPLLSHGYLLGAFVTRALYYFPEVSSDAVADPIAILDGFNEFVIDVTQGGDGAIYVATAGFDWTSAIQRLEPPARGDCNADTTVDWRDLGALAAEIADGQSHQTETAHDGEYRGSWGCDVNTDGVIDQKDYRELLAMLSPRRRSVR